MMMGRERTAVGTRGVYPPFNGFFVLGAGGSGVGNVPRERRAAPVAAPGEDEV